MQKTFYITTTLPYANSKPHIGHALEFVRADVVARYKRLAGFEVFFNTGTDEHGLKIYKQAQKEGKDVRIFLDEQVEHFKNLTEKLNISYDKFIRTTDSDHEKSAQEFWKICDQNGYIYKKTYAGLYCVGCENYLTEKDLVNGKCPHHPNQEPEIIEEENYFFKYSDFTQKILEFYENQPDFVIPDNRFKEIKSFVKDGLKDFSISRLKEKMPWGVPVPGDNDHVIYVWFDALVNYISTLGWPNNKNNFEKFWINGTPVQYCGKDNLQYQSARWQAMLLAAGLPNSKHIIINGFVTSGNQKMSKTVGNVIDPMEIINEYGSDALRYFLIRELSPHEDSDFTIERFKEAYNANLANGIGNLTNRVLKMSEDNINDLSIDFANPKLTNLPQCYVEAFAEFNLQKAADFIWDQISKIDQKIQETQPFKLVKENKEEGIKIIKELIFDLAKVSILLKPFLPETSKNIQEAIRANKKPLNPLFVRKD